jgi:hypothetical protein
MVNHWKISTLLLAGALTFVVGRGAVQDAEACDGELPNAEQVTRLRLARGLAFLERAEDELEAATEARPKQRTAALAEIAKAKVAIELALSPEPEERPRPRPIPLPRKDTRAQLIDPWGGGTLAARR